ncbi:alpha-hydroxy-acid oxidizing protein [bacterium]|nr:MAG: alpha-hydroxy-acid oxidizing protein [bacterium]
MPRVLNSIEDLRQLARRRIPRAIFEYADQGAYDELTYRRNRSDLEAFEFRQRVLRDVSETSLATTMLGEAASFPLAIGPTGLTGLFHRNGEMEGALAAEAFGIPFTLSTMSICSIEDVRSVTTKPFWFQLYVMRDRGFTAELIQRAAAASCSALMLTVDMPIQGLRRRDAKNGLSIPPRLTLGNAWEIARRPAWLGGVLLGRRRTFGNLEARLRDSGGLSTLAHPRDVSPGAREIELRADPLRERWPGKLLLKGVMDPQDAREAVAAGVDAIVVSNHGGRQLDGASSTIAALPGVVDAVAGRTEVHFDGGIRSGQDLLKALALGARGGFIGKAFLYGLAAEGRTGVTRALTILRDELKVSMALTGCRDVRDIDAHILRNRLNVP